MKHTQFFRRFTGMTLTVLMLLSLFAAAGCGSGDGGTDTSAVPDVTTVPDGGDTAAPGTDDTEPPVEPGPELDASDLVLLGTANAQGYYYVGKLGFDGVFSLAKRFRSQGAETIQFDLGSAPAANMSTEATVAGARVLNAVGCRVALIGRNECSGGAETLRAYLETLEADVVACNLADGGELSEYLSTRVVPYTVVEAGGHKIGFIGVMDPDEEAYLPSGIRTLSVAESAERVNEAAESCRGEGADTVVLLTTIQRDEVLAADWNMPIREGLSEERLAALREVLGKTTTGLCALVRGVDLVCSAKPGDCSYALLTDADGNPVPVISAKNHVSSVMEVLLSADGLFLPGLITDDYYQIKDETMTAALRAIEADPDAGTEIPELPAPAAPDRSADGDLVILFTNDMHNRYTSELGYDGISAYKKRVGAQNPASLFLTHSGDAFEREADILSGVRSTEIMDHIGYEYCTLGNNELDYDNADVKSFIDAAEMTYLCCNIRYTGEHPESDPFADLPGHAVTEKAGRKIGFVGVTTTKNVTQHTEHFTDPDTGEFVYDFGQESDEHMAEMIQSEVDACIEEGAETVILLAHLGTGVSEKMIALTDGIDIVLDGHSHTIIPFDIRRNAEGNDVYRASAGSHFGCLGQLVMTRGGLIMTTLIRSDSYTEKDPEMTAYIEDVLADTAEQPAA